MDGTHSIEQAAVVTEKVLAATFKAMSDHKLLLEGCLLKPNMVRKGSESKQVVSAADIGKATVRVLQHTVPVALPGVMFLSGGMSEELATEALNACNTACPKAKRPWHLSFSYVVFERGVRECHFSFTFLLCHSNHQNIIRIAHSYGKNIT